MKKLLFLIFISSLVIASCTKDEGLIDEGDTSKGLFLADASYGESGGGGGGGEGSGGEGSGQGGENIDPGQITAGEWNDLDNWTFWKDLENENDYNGMADYWEYNLDDRISVRLSNNSDVPLVDLKVELINGDNEVLWVNRTDNSGTAELWPYLKTAFSSGTDNLRIKIEGNIYDNIISYSEGINELVLDKEVQNPAAKKIDIAFMVDATGSMSDELEYLKVELIDVIEQVKTENPEAVLNMGSIFYRDEGDDYVTKKSDFSVETNKTVDFIKQQSANGGGDFPEAVHSAMHASLKGLQWSSSATARILFVLLDAPPHYDAQIVDQIHSLTADAAEMGVKIIPITASGIDKETEFLMRYLSIATNGTYVFITNHSGIGGDHLEPSIGQYEVEFLNELMVRLINKYLE